MKKLAREITQIILVIILMICGLILILRYLDGRLIIGLVMMAAGALILFVMARNAVVAK